MNLKVIDSMWAQKKYDRIYTNYLAKQKKDAKQKNESEVIRVNYIYVFGWNQWSLCWVIDAFFNLKMSSLINKRLFPCLIAMIKH